MVVIVNWNWAAIGCFNLWCMRVSVQMIPLDYQCDYPNYTIPVLGMFMTYFLNNVLFKSLEIMSFSIIAQRLSVMHQILFFIVAGIITSDIVSLANLYIWLFSGVCMGFVLYALNALIISHDLESVFLISFGLLVMYILPTVWFMAYPGIISQVVISATLFLLFVAYLYKKL